MPMQILPVNFPLLSFPESERESIWQLSLNINLLPTYADHFEETIRLFDWCKSQSSVQADKPIGPNDQFGSGFFSDSASSFRSWMCKAARVGVLEIYDFGQMAYSCGGSGIFGQCPSLRAKVDMLALKRALQVFDTAFPDYKQIRHGASHVGDIFAKTNNVRQHSSLGTEHGISGISSSGGATVLLAGAIINGEKFTTLWNGKFVSSEINQEALQTLHKTASGIRFAYRKFIHNGNDLSNPLN